MSDVEIRDARVEELDAVGRLTLAAYNADGWAKPGGGYARELLDAAARWRDAELLVAVGADGELLGTVTVCPPGTPFSEISRPGELEIRMLAVAPEARGRGVGTALTREVLRRAAERGVDRVVLCSITQMHTAQRIYRRLGFTRLPERDWRIGDHSMLAFALENPGAAG